MTTQETEKAERVVIDVETARIALGISRGCIYAAIHAGQIPHIICGRRILIPRAAFERMLLNPGSDVKKPE